MSNDRHEDKRVSDAYKELANERTPEHLNKKVLAMAIGATRKPGYSRWMAWSRPVAWAATIALCLAITLELAQDPAMTVSVDSSSPTAKPEMEEMEENKRDNDESLSKDKELANEERDLVLKREDLELQQEVAESIAETAASEKTSLARSASKQSFSEPAPVAASYTEVDDSSCAAEVRAAPGDWLDCIVELEAAGLDAAATAEREQLIDTFPDFKLP